MKTILPALFFALALSACSDGALTGPDSDRSVAETVETVDAATDIAAKQAPATSFGDFTGLVSSLEGDFTKFYEKGNKAAGTRIRKGMQDLKTLAHDTRVVVQRTVGGAPADDHMVSVGYPVNPYEGLEELVLSMEDDYAKFFDKGNLAAGRRLVVSLKTLADLAQDIRVDVQTNR